MFTSRALYALALIALGWVTAGRAAAQDEGRYRALIAEAVEEFDAGRWAEARALFTQAHEAMPNARTLRGIGMASFELREYVAAIRALTAAMSDTRRPLTSAQRSAASTLLTRARTFTGRYRVTLSPETAALTVDGRPAVREADGALLLELGSYDLAASAEGFTTWTRRLDVHGSEDEALTVRLEARTAPPPDERVPPDVIPERDPMSRRRRRQLGGGERVSRTSIPGLVLTIGGGVLAVGAVASAVFWVDRESEIDKCQPAATCLNHDTLTSQRDLAFGLTIGLGAGAIISLSVGALLLVTGGDEEPEPRVPALSCMPGLGGVLCRGRF